MKLPFPCTPDAAHILTRVWEYVAEIVLPYMKEPESTFGWKTVGEITNPIFNMLAGTRGINERIYFDARENSQEGLANRLAQIQKTFESTPVNILEAIEKVNGDLFMKPKRAVMASLALDKSCLNYQNQLILNLRDILEEKTTPEPLQQIFERLEKVKKNDEWLYTYELGLPSDHEWYNYIMERIKKYRENKTRQLLNKHGEQLLEHIRNHIDRFIGRPRFEVLREIFYEDSGETKDEKIILQQALDSLTSNLKRIWIQSPIWDEMENLVENAILFAELQNPRPVKTYLSGQYTVKYKGRPCTVISGELLDNGMYKVKVRYGRGTKEITVRKEELIEDHARGLDHNAPSNVTRTVEQKILIERLKGMNFDVTEFLRWYNERTKNRNKHPADDNSSANSKKRRQTTSLHQPTPFRF